MARKSNQELIDQQLKYALTVGQAITILQKFDHKKLLGVVGHFGEFWTISNITINGPFHEQESYLTPDGDWRAKLEWKVDVVSMEIPDIGEAPD